MIDQSLKKYYNFLHMRINAYLSKAGVSSRRKADVLIESGKVKINGQLAKLSDQVKDEDVVTVEGEEVRAKQNRYYLLYKPVGYTSTVDDEHAEKKVIDLIPDNKGLFPVGRLDKDSEGLIIITNDGEFAQKLIHPRFDHDKEYEVHVKLPFKDRTKKLEDALKFFKCGIRLDDKKTQPAQISLIAQEGQIAKFKIVLKEGLKRQIRRTFEKAGLNVVKLKRTRISSYLLDDLLPGDFKEFDVSPQA
jgi:pseudouridine synthase